MNEQQISMIENQAAAIAVDALDSGDLMVRQLADDALALIAEIRSLRAKLDAANVAWQEEHAARLVLGEQLKLAEAKAMFWWNEATHPNVEVQP